MQDVFLGAANATWLPTQTIAIRMLAALLAGALMGLEREKKHRAAGLRTYMLVSLAAATVAMLTIEIAHLQTFDSEAIRIDPTRSMQAITAGVAFLAAGLIVFAKGEVHGLTTGAGLWLAGAVGLAAGLGFFTIAALATVLAIVVLWFLARVEERLEPEIKANGRNGPDKRTKGNGGA